MLFEFKILSAQFIAYRTPCKPLSNLKYLLLTKDIPGGGIDAFFLVKPCRFRGVAGCGHGEGEGGGEGRGEGEGGGHGCGEGEGGDEGRGEAGMGCAGGLGGAGERGTCGDGGIGGVD